MCVVFSIYDYYKVYTNNINVVHLMMLIEMRIDMAYIEMKNSYKRYQVGDTGIIANNDVNFEVKRAGLVIIFKVAVRGKIDPVLNI